MKTMVEFEIAGTALFTHQETREVKDRELPKRRPEGCIAYRFYDVEPGGGRINQSGTVFFGDLLTQAEVKKLKRQRVLYKNMVANNIEQVVRTEGNHFYKFNPERDLVI